MTTCLGCRYRETSSFAEYCMEPTELGNRRILTSVATRSGNRCAGHRLYQKRETVVARASPAATAVGRGGGGSGLAPIDPWDAPFPALMKGDKSPGDIIEVLGYRPQQNGNTFVDLQYLDVSGKRFLTYLYVSRFAGINTWRGVHKVMCQWYPMAPIPPSLVIGNVQATISP